MALIGWLDTPPLEDWLSRDGTDVGALVAGHAPYPSAMQTVITTELFKLDAPAAPATMGAVLLLMIGS